MPRNTEYNLRATVSSSKTVGITYCYLHEVLEALRVHVLEHMSLVEYDSVEGQALEEDSILGTAVHHVVPADHVSIPDIILTPIYFTGESQIYIFIKMMQNIEK